MTSSHGTGKKFTVSSDHIVGLTIICSNGKIVHVSPFRCVEQDIDGNEIEENPKWLMEKDGKVLGPEDIWRASQTNLGAFGIVYDVTIVLGEKIYALFVSETSKWEKYFGTDPSCAKNVSDLNNEWDTVEFWYYPVTVGELDDPSIKDIFTKKITPCPYLTVTKTMSNELSEKQNFLYEVVEKDLNSPELVSQLAIQSTGARFAAKIWKWAVKLHNNKSFNKIGTWMIKYILVFSGWIAKMRWGFEPTYDKEGNVVKKGQIWKVPNWIAIHPVLNANAVVETCPILDIEWEIPVPTFTPEGFKNSIGAFRHLLLNVLDSTFKRNEYPVSVNVEMRILRGSNSPMSMMYNHQPMYDSEQGKERLTKGFASPEIVSSSPNPWWVPFYERMNREITCFDKNEKKFGENIRYHHSKQFVSLEGVLKYLRGVYDHPVHSSYPHETFNTAFKLWKEVRTRFDNDGIFVNAYIDQLFYNYKDTFVPENGYIISEGGDVKENHTSNKCVIL
eukprot:TRINITY_DN3407_c0_g1_i3.p1 TRINITY_DN3407_c0_g1~~TRINITY_DN3407_c0_g1_i3.p1  ORF type:complete len:503 (-),score=140.97 TRINITY_DN3407_c0_g1_i3:111-1619(-)